jgi:hypothetical protein
MVDPEDGGTMLLRNAGIQLWGNAASHSKRPQSELPVTYIKVHQGGRRHKGQDSTKWLWLHPDIVRYVPVYKNCLIMSELPKFWSATATKLIWND